MSMNFRKCPECDGPVAGRIDKKFCSSFCRIAFHNSRREADPTEFSRIKNSLIRNRGVLKVLYIKGIRQITADQLKTHRFDFGVFTGSDTLYNAASLQRYFDYGLLIEGEEIRIVASPEIRELINS